MLVQLLDVTVSFKLFPKQTHIKPKTGALKACWMKILHSFNNEEWKVNPLTSSLTFKNLNLQLAKLRWHRVFSQCILNSRFGCLFFFLACTSVHGPQGWGCESTGWICSTETKSPPWLSEQWPSASAPLPDRNAQVCTLGTGSPVPDQFLSIPHLWNLWSPLDKDRDKVNMVQQAMCTEQNQWPRWAVLMGILLLWPVVLLCSLTVQLWAHCVCHVR